eukprot:c17480_g1_i1 orf=106-651(+)
MGLRRVAILCGALLLALCALTQLCMCGPEEHIVGGKESEPAAAAPSFFKSWSDWAQDKVGFYGKKEGGAAVQKQKTPSSGGGWFDWAYEKISSFPARASKSTGDATQAGKEKVKVEGEAAAKEGKDIWEAVKGVVKEESEKAKEYVGKANENVYHHTNKAYEAGKEQGRQASHKVKKEAEL